MWRRRVNFYEVRQSIGSYDSRLSSKNKYCGAEELTGINKRSNLNRLVNVQKLLLKTIVLNVLLAIGTFGNDPVDVLLVIEIGI